MRKAQEWGFEMARLAGDDFDQSGAEIIISKIQTDAQIDTAKMAADFYEYVQHAAACPAKGEYSMSLKCDCGLSELCQKWFGIERITKPFNVA